MTGKLKKVIIESPYAGDLEKNIKYARLCMKDSLDRGEAPFASHLLYIQQGILNDSIKEERELGINAGLEWGKEAELTVVYSDLGITKGMTLGIDSALNNGRDVEYRTLKNYKEFLDE